MKALLISTNMEQASMSTPPLGLFCVAEAARCAGHPVRVVDLMAEKDVRGRLVREFSKFSPDVVGLSIRNIDDQTMQSPRFLLAQSKEVLELCRPLSDAPIVLGGAGYSMYPRSALAYLGADLGIQGEGESIFPRLLNRLEKGKPFFDLPGLHGPGKPPESTVFEKNLDRFPLPDPDLLDLSVYESEDLWVPVQTRRGCPIGCSYCSTASIEGRCIRKRSPEIVVDQLKKWVEAGFSRFHFVDNTFNLPPSYAEGLCDQIIASGLPVKWLCILYPGALDEKLVEKMSRAGCCHASLGFESGSPSILKSMNKRFGPKAVIRASRMLRNHGIQRMGFLLLGGPGETRETVKESLEFAHKLDPELFKITVGVRIYPGTRLARYAAEKGVVTADDTLLFPRFYMEEGLEEWIESQIDTWIQRHPHWLR